MIFLGKKRGRKRIRGVNSSFTVFPIFFREAHQDPRFRDPRSSNRWTSIIVLCWGKMVGNMGKREKFSSFSDFPIFFRPNGPQIRDRRIELSLSPNFGAERTLTAPFSVTSSIPLFPSLKIVIIFEKKGGLTPQL